MHHSWLFCFIIAIVSVLAFVFAIGGFSFLVWLVFEHFDALANWTSKKAPWIIALLFAVLITLIAIQCHESGRF